MPSIYLSPSTQEWNQYVTGGSEEYHMNQLADRLEPYLRANAIAFTRNTPDMTAASSIRQSNQGNYDLHLALHSNAAPPGRYGEVRGSEAYYSPNSRNGMRGATLVADHIRDIYPIADRVRIIPTTSIGEVRQTRAPAVFLEVAYHDNAADANWITQNMDGIAQAIALGLADYFGHDMVWPITPRTGTVTVGSGVLNIRGRPSMDAPVLARAPNGAQMTLYGQNGDWYGVQYGNMVGFVNANYIQ